MAPNATVALCATISTSYCIGSPVLSITAASRGYIYITYIYYVRVLMEFAKFSSFNNKPDSNSENIYYEISKNIGTIVGSMHSFRLLSTATSVYVNHNYIFFISHPQYNNY